MSLLYSAAEYFVEAVCKSPTFSISHNDLQKTRYVVVNELKQEVALYIEAVCKNDFLFIFKKFPDIFVLNKDSVTLTQAFLSQYFLKSSWRKTDQNQGNSVHHKKWAAAYFNNILKTYGPQHYLRLFHWLKNDTTHHQPARYFSDYTKADAYNFFQAYSDVFELVDKRVYLRDDAPLDTTSLGQTPALNDVIESVHFLLFCFTSLHYIELRQCISYVQENAEAVFKDLTLIKERQFFENIPESIMDEYGFLSLRAKKVVLSMDNETKIILLIVCILAFKREVPFEDLAEAVANKLSPPSNFFSNLSATQQIQFIKKYSAYFCISDSGYVSLLPEFILPVCTFEQTSECEINTQHGISETKEVSAGANNCLETNSLDNTNIVGSNSSFKNINKFIILGLSSTENERIRIAVFYLLKYFSPLDFKRLLESLLHVLDDVRSSFRELSQMNKHDFVRVLCWYTRTASLTTTLGIEVFVELSEKEKFLLFVTYTLTNETKVHYLKIRAAMEEKKVNELIKYSGSGDYTFFVFKSHRGYIGITNDGYTALSESFNSVRTMVDSYSDFLSANQNRLLDGDSWDSLQGCDQNILPGENLFSLIQNEDTGYFGSTLWAERNRNLASGAVVQVKVENSSCQLPDVIYKAINYSDKLLRSCFRCTTTEKILKVTVFALEDVNNYFCELSRFDKNVFVKDCHQFINESKRPYPTAILGEHEENVLLITHMLLDKKQLTYLEVFKELYMCGRRSLICKQRDGEKYMYLKRDKHFDVDRDGKVILDSSFKYVDSYINSALKYMLRTQHKFSNSAVDFKLDSQNKNTVGLPHENAHSTFGSQNKQIGLHHQNIGLKLDSLNALTDFAEQNINPKLGSKNGPIGLPPLNINPKLDSQNELIVSPRQNTSESSLVQTKNLDSRRPRSSRMKIKVQCNGSQREVTLVNNASKTSNNFVTSGTSTSEADKNEANCYDVTGLIQKTKNLSLNTQLNSTSKNDSLTNSNTVSESNNARQLEIPKESECVSKASFSTFDSVSLRSHMVEKKALNFFVILLGNYKDQDWGFSVDFLKDHILKASYEVQSFMYENYTDFISFFKKHQSVFYVSPYSNNVFLLST